MVCESTGDRTNEIDTVSSIKCQIDGGCERNQTPEYPPLAITMRLMRTQRLIDRVYQQEGWSRASSNVNIGEIDADVSRLAYCTVYVLARMMYQVSPRARGENIR